MSDESLRATASKLCQKRGRLVGLIKLSNADADASKPWRGPPANSAVTLSVKAVMTRLSDTDMKLDFIRNTTKKFIVAALDVEAAAAQAGDTTLGDARVFTQLTDEGATVEIVRVIAEKPGDLPIAYVIYVEG